MPINPSVTVAAVSAGDAEALAALHAACFAQGWSAGAFRDLLADAQSAAWSARDSAGVTVGLALVRNVAGEAEILTLGVLPQYRRHAVGAMLVARICDWAAEQGVDSIFLEVQESNAAALALYRKAGFRHIGLRKDYYRTAEGGSDHAVVMRYSAIP